MFLSFFRRRGKHRVSRKLRMILKCLLIVMNVLGVYKKIVARMKVAAQLSRHFIQVENWSPGKAEKNIECFGHHSTFYSQLFTKMNALHLTVYVW